MVCFPSSQHATASPTHGTEITSSHVAEKEQPEIPASDATAPINTAQPSTPAAQEELVTPISAPASLLDHVSILSLYNICDRHCFEEVCGGAPPAESTCDNVTLPQVVGFIDRVCSYASAAMNKASSALAVVHQGMYPSKPSPSNLEGLVAPFSSGSSIMADYTHAQTVCGSEFTLQLLLGHQVACDYEKVVGEFPKRPDGKTASLSHVKSEASRLVEKLVTKYQKRVAKAVEAATRRSRSESAC